MNTPPTPTFTEEHSLFYLWKPEPDANRIQLAGEYKSEAQLQKRSFSMYGVFAKMRNAYSSFQ